MSHILLMTIPAAIGLNPKPIEDKLDSAPDWIRFAPNSWLIYTDDSADAWYRRINNLPEIQRTMVFICEANLQDLSGKLSPFAWDWIKNIRFGGSPLSAPEMSQPQPVGAV